MTRKPLCWLSRMVRWGCVHILLFLFVAPAAAQNGILGSQWVLDQSQSTLQFQSVKNGSKVETSSFATFSGGVDETGGVSISVELESVDTKVDLRNVRMRFLFFETYKYPTATVTAKLDKNVLEVLEDKRRLRIPVEFELDLHGVTNTLTVETVLTMFADDQVAISSSSPVNIAVDQFGLLEGIRKLEEAADVTIVPSGSVSFDLTFKKEMQLASATDVAVAQTAAPASSSVALESTGNFSSEECAGRFEILSRADAIVFDVNSTDLKPESNGLLEEVRDIISRCPDLRLVIEGHTDSAGSDKLNMQISAGRAQSVYQYLIEQGVSGDRIRSVGYGETRPLVPNNTRRNRARNRRIEFATD